jgi:hypothetical protein
MKAAYFVWNWGFLLFYFRFYDLRLYTTEAIPPHNVHAIFWRGDPAKIRSMLSAWKWCALKASMVMLAPLAYEQGYNHHVVALLGYIGLFLIVAPAGQMNEAHVYRENEPGVRGAIAFYFHSWVLGLPSKINAIGLILFLNVIIWLVRKVYPNFSILSAITHLSWLPDQFGWEDYNLFTQGALAYMIMNLFLKSGISCPSSIVDLRFVIEWVPRILIGYWILSFMLAYTAVIDVPGYHFGIVLLIAILTGR